MKDDFPIDPPLRSGFDNTPNDQRSKNELDTWWDCPYVITHNDGTFDVRCLNGGAWDRSTWLGNAPTAEQAKALGMQKQTEWERMRARPLMGMEEDGRCSVVLMQQRPDEDMKVLAIFDTSEEVAEYMKKNFPRSE